MVFCLCLAVPLVALSSQSLWIDEALTAAKAQQPTLAAWWRLLVEEKLSDVQMPLYMLWVWAFAKVFGSGEWVLRAAGLPWFYAGLVAWLTLRPSSRRSRMATGLVAGLCPFAWSYLDEARPYAMQLGASLLIGAALLRLLGRERASAGRERFWLWAFGAGLVVLSGSSLIGMIWAGAALAVAAVVCPRERRVEWLRTHWALALGVAAALAGFGGYFLWTLHLGARASAVAGTDWRSFVFVWYELLGFGGLGPGRLEIREAGLAAFKAHLPLLGCYGVIVAVVLAAGAARLWETSERKAVVSAGACCVLAAFFLFCAGWVAHFRVLGRHFTPMVPVLLLLLSVGLTSLWSRRRLLARTITAAFCVLALCSCLSLRFTERHQRDDYRSAAAVAKAALAAHQTVWWNADAHGAAYYGLPMARDERAPGKALALGNPSAEQLAGLPVPDWIIVSKPDLYDAAGALAGYLERNGFVQERTLPAFRVWQRRSR